MSIVKVEIDGKHVAVSEAPSTLDAAMAVVTTLASELTGVTFRERLQSKRGRSRSTSNSS